MVMVTTWVASQKLESSTARIISMVSPDSPRCWATIREAKPKREAVAVPKPLRYILSMMRPRTTMPQPTKTAEEYRLVTGGRPWRMMRKNRPRVCTMVPAKSRPKAVGRRSSGFQAQEKQTARKAARKMIMPAKKGWARLYTTSRLAWPRASGLRPFTRVFISARAVLKAAGLLAT